MDKPINSYADKMLDQIRSVINDKLKNQPSIKSAIVRTVNQDGTVNVYIPPDTATTFNYITNQTPFILRPGDGVELMLKSGSYSNCWIIAKHNVNRKTDLIYSDVDINASDVIEQ